MKVKGKIFFVFLILCSAFLVRSETVSAAGEKIIVNGSDIASGQTVSCGQGTARYDPGTKTLRLENVTINEDSGGAPLLRGIEIQGEGITVELAGDNTINAHFGIESSAPLNIRGISGGRLTVHVNQSLSGNAGRGIFIVGGGLTVSDASLQFIIENTGDSNGYGIYICGKDNRISNSSIKVTAKSGPSTDPKSQAINATGADSLTISDNSGIIIDNVDEGIAVTGKLTVSKSSLEIKADQYAVSCGDMEILDTARLNIYANNGIGLHANNNISISGSSVSTESKKNNGLVCGNLEVEASSELTARGYWPALFVNDKAVIKDSTVDTGSTDDVAIFCKGPVEMADSRVSAVDSILAHGNISITGGATEIGEGSITSREEVCVGGTVTSNGVKSYENINSNSGKVIFLDADYSNVDQAIAKAEALNKEAYTSFEDVEKAINAVVRGKDIREQDIVDGYAAAIEAAVAALEPVSSVQYEVIEGFDQTVKKGKNEDVTIRADGDFNKFVSVSMDGVEIAIENYTAASGSTIITLKSGYIYTLSAGAHTVAIHYTDGTAQTTLTLAEEDDPSTQDPSTQDPSTQDPSTQDPSAQDPPAQQTQNPPAQNKAQEQSNKAKTSPVTGDNSLAGWITALISSAAVCLLVRKYQIRLSR